MSDEQEILSEPDIEEESEELQADHRPWDPSQIRITTKNWSLRQVVDEIEDGTIDLAPAFQRQYVWKDAQKSLLIESIILGIPLPAFYFDQDEHGAIQVVDGVQRLTTIRDFFADSFIPQVLEYRTDLVGKPFSSLDPMWKRRLHQTQIVAHVIDPQTPADLKFDIFRRINTGGTPLVPQEIRHCMVKSRSREFLALMAGDPVFVMATGGALVKNRRMEDREFTLRFIAFRQRGSVERYTEARTFDGFLLEAMKLLDDPAAYPDNRLATLRADYQRGLSNAFTVFGKHAFRRWPEGTDRKNPLNKALFETWTVALCEFERDDIRARWLAIQTQARQAMTHDREFNLAISGSTGDPQRVRRRFQVVKEIAAEAGR